MSDHPETPVSPAARRELAAIASALIDSFIDSGKTRPAIPPGRRDEIVDALVRAMVEHEWLVAYVDEIERAREARGVDLELLGRPAPDLPDQVIARDGFGALGDEALAEIAIDPSALRVLAEYLWGEIEPGEGEGTPEWGDWWWKAVSAEDSAGLPFARGTAQEKTATQRPAEDPATIPFDADRPAKRHDGGLPPWVRRFAPLAASLLLGIFLGRVAFDRGGDFVLAAGASPLIGPGRGSDRDLGLQFESPLAGFATIVALAPGGPAEVYPALGRDDIAVDARSVAEYGPLPPGTREAFVIVTETPASDPIRRAIRDGAGGSADGANLRGLLEERLRAKGYRRMAIGAAEFPAE